MKAALFSVFALLLSISVFGQFSANSEETEQKLRSVANIKSSNSGKSNFEQRYANAQGNAYLFDDWQVGKAKLIGSDTFEVTLLMNIDLVSHLLILQLEDGSIGFISPYNIHELTVREKLYNIRNIVVLPESVVEGTGNGQKYFYELMHDGRFKLLKRTFKRISKPIATPYEVSDDKTEVITTETYWLNKPEKPYQKITLRRKSIEKALPEYQTAIKQITKKNNLYFYESQDVVTLLGFLEKF